MEHSNMTRSGLARHNFAFALAVGAVLGAFSVLTISALADGDPTDDTVPRMFPYEGYLEHDGLPVTGTQTLEVSIFDGEGSASPVYIQEVTVEVYSGRFTATIGPTGRNVGGGSVDVVDVVNGADDLYLALTIMDGDTQVALSERQRLFVTPYAIWTTSASDFEVFGALRVDGEATFDDNLVVSTGELRVGTGDPDGFVIEAGTIGHRRGRDRVGGIIEFPTDPGTGSGDFGFMSYTEFDGDNTEIEIGVGNDPVDQIILSHSGATKLTVNSDGVHVATNLVATHNTRDTCAWEGAGCNQRTCGSGKFMAGIQLHHNEDCAGSGNDSDHGSYSLYCCEL